MKFGKYLQDKQRPEWAAHYVDYRALKDLVKAASGERGAGGAPPSPRTASLTVQRARDSADSAEERFFALLEAEVAKVGAFTAGTVARLRGRLLRLQRAAEAANREGGEGEAASPRAVAAAAPAVAPNGAATAAPAAGEIAAAADGEIAAAAGGAGELVGAPRAALEAEAAAVGDEFLALEKYVNLNYMGFHKILKKHDKRLPGAPCRAFYTSHLHAQPWVQGNYSDLLVALSAVHAALRGDAAAARRRGAGAASAAGAAGAAGAHRSVARYWVRMSDVSAIKHHLLQHLPVRQPDEGEYMGDACLVNAVHLDNAMLELYHARLDRRPGAAAVRLAWAGDAEPDEVSVEREAVGPPGAGDGDKDGEDATGSGLNAAAAAAAAAADYGFEGEGVATPCFPLPEAAVARFLAGELPAAEAAAHWRARPGRFSDAELARMAALFADLSRAVDAKQLRPVVRTQYVSTFFQMPFDAAVRAKLDTNICMFREGAAEEDEDEDEGGSGSGSGRHAVGRGGGSMHRWRRDPALPARRAEVSRFPHAVLELRLALAPGATTPAWVAALAESGLLTEVEGFSKAAHGVAALLPEAVQAVPYWVDDETVRASMLACAPEAGSDSEGEGGSAAPRGRGAARSKPRKGAAPAGGAELEEPLLAAERRPPPPARAGPRRPSLIEWWFAKPRMAAPRARVPGVVADARPEPKTHLANERTYLSWLHMALTMGGVAGAMLGFAEGGRRDAGAASMELVALILLPVAFAMCGYALVVYTWRADAIRARTAVYYDDRRGPLALAAVVVAALGAILVLSAVDLAAGLRHQGQHVPRAPPPPPPELRFSRAF